MLLEVALPVVPGKASASTIYPNSWKFLTGVSAQSQLIRVPVDGDRSESASWIPRSF